MKEILQMLSWNFIFLCVLAFSVLPFNGAQRHKSLEKSASASDEEQFIRGQSREHYGVYEVERCLRDDIRAKLCDMDNLLNDTERNLINSALNEFESVSFSSYWVLYFFIWLSSE